MGDQGNRDQGQHLKENIHGQDVRGKGHAQGNAVGHDKEGEEGKGPVVVLHIAESVNGDQRPHQGDHAREKAGKTVRAKGNGKTAGEIVDRDRMPAAAQYGDPDQQTGDADQGLTIQGQAPFGLDRMGQQEQASQHRQQDRQ